MRMIKKDLPLLFKFNTVNFNIEDSKFDLSEMEVLTFYLEEQKLTLELIKKRTLEIYSWANVDYLKLTFNQVLLIDQSSTPIDKRYNGMKVDLIDTGKFEKDGVFSDVNENGQACFNLIFTSAASDIYYFSFLSSGINIEYIV